MPTVSAPKNYLLALLAATTLGGAILAWRQSAELARLRTAAMNKDERADLQRRLWDLEKRNRALQEQIAGGRASGGGADDPAGAGRAGAEGRERGPGGRIEPRERGALQQFNAIRELISKPEVQAMITLQQRAGVESRYAALFRNLNLPPDQIEKLKSLLVERSTTLQDIFSAAAEQGISPRDNPDAFRRMIGDAQNQINASIRATIGEAGFAQLSNYEQTMPQRAVVYELQQRLSYSNTPLTLAQGEQLIQVLAANAPQRPAGPPPGGPGGLGPDINLILSPFGGGPGMGPLIPGLDGGPRGGGPPPITPAAVAQAQSVLSPPQLTALQQIQQQQQTQQQLRQIIGDTLAPGPAAGTGVGPTPGPPGKDPVRKRPGVKD